MKRRFLTIGLCAVVLVSLASVPSKGQSDVERTPWGAQDLQGVWDFRTITPLQRPEDLGEQAFLSEEEAANLEQEAVERDARLLVAEARRTEAGGSVGAYNNFWMDRGTNVVGNRRTSLIVDPPNGRYPPLTAQAERLANARRGYRQEHPADTFLDSSAFDRCILGFNQGPPMTPGGYNQNIQLFQTAEYVVILNEMVHDPRIVALDGRPHLPEDMRQWNGDARGHWDGDTLVIESTNFTDQTASFAPNAAVAMGTGENLLLTERLSRVNADVMRYEFTVDDPTTFTRPFTAAIPLRRSEEPMYEYACHEGNYGLLNILRGAREDERAASETQP